MRCSLLYGAEDPSIAGMVLDSAFSNLYDLMMELADVCFLLEFRLSLMIVIEFD